MKTRVIEVKIDEDGFVECPFLDGEWQCCRFNDNDGMECGELDMDTDQRHIASECPLRNQKIIVQLT